MVVGIAVVGLALAAAVVVVLFARSGRSDGPGGALPRADMGDQADAGALGQQVDRALQRPRAGPVPSPATACATEARATYGRDLGPLVHAARLRWQGTPAVVLVYRAATPPSNLDHRVLVLAREECRLLVAQSL